MYDTCTAGIVRPQLSGLACIIQDCGHTRCVASVVPRHVYKARWPCKFVHRQILATHSGIDGAWLVSTKVHEVRRGTTINTPKGQSVHPFKLLDPKELGGLSWVGPDEGIKPLVHKGCKGTNSWGNDCPAHGPNSGFPAQTPRAVQEQPVVCIPQNSHFDLAGIK